MVPNPFIELARDPVATFALFAYAVVMLAAALGGLSYAIREGLVVAARTKRPNRQQEGWMGTWPDGAGFLPPGEWTVHAAKVCIALALTFASLSTLAWLMGA